MVDFEFVEPGIRAGGQWVPFLKMRWGEGLALNDFVGQHLDRPKTLRTLLDLWVKLAARLRQAEVAHADLQHGNVLLVPRSGGRLALKLIDYDGMHVPAVAGTRSGELGHPAYQHPQRLREGTYNAEVDRFSHLAIYTAVWSQTGPPPPAKSGQMAHPDDLPGSPEEPLAKRRKSSDPGHGSFLHGLVPVRAGKTSFSICSNGEKDPFSSNYARLLTCWLFGLTWLIDPESDNGRLRSFEGWHTSPFVVHLG